MLVDVFSKRCDITVIVSADSDMIPSVEIIKNFAPKHPVYAFIPPTQKSYALVSKCDKTVWLEWYKARFMQSMLPAEITLESGHTATLYCHKHISPVGSNLSGLFRALLPQSVLFLILLTL